MTYILLDLEWDNTFYKKTGKFINEIVEFGAVKLDDNFSEIDRFNCMVKSSVTKRLSGRFKNLTGITNEQMQSGIPFADALKKYKSWAGKNAITLTWSDSDIYTLYDNCLLFTGEGENSSLGKYVDLQKYTQFELAKQGNPQKNQISLSNAAALLNIDIEKLNLHNALDDSKIAGAILKLCYNQNDFEKFIIDTDNEEFFKKLHFKPYYIKEIDSDLINKKDFSFACPKCGGKTSRITKYRFKTPWFSAIFNCKKCSVRFTGYVSFKRYYDHTVIKRRTLISSKNQAVKKSDNLIPQK